MSQSVQGPVASERVVRAFAAYARGAGAVAVLVGTVVLLGWSQDIGWLTSVLPGGAQMKPNAAVGLMLAGFALLSMASLSSQAQRPVMVLSFLLLALGATTIYQYVTGVDLAIDGAIFPDSGLLTRDPLSMRMSQMTAMGFVLLGFLGLSTSPRMTQLFALLVLALALFALGSASYNLGSRERFIGLNPIAVHTAVCLLLLALGWLAARPDQGIMRAVSANSLGGTLARYALLPAMLIPSLLSYLAQLVQSRGWLSPAATVVILAVSSGLAVALMIWWVSLLLDRVERQRRLAHELRDSAETDSLTGLGNRRLFDVTLAGLQQRRRDGDSRFSLLLIDLDRFKQYNDTFGHLAGDEALRLTGRILQHALRPGDVAARYGGEEFAVLLPHIDAIRAARVAERICADFRAHRWPNRQVTVSIGVSDAATEDGPDDLIKRADAALYQAKHGGRDRAAVVTAEAGANQSPMPPASPATESAHIPTS